MEVRVWGEEGRGGGNGVEGREGREGGGIGGRKGGCGGRGKGKKERGIETEGRVWEEGDEKWRSGAEMSYVENVGEKGREKNGVKKGDRGGR